MTAPRPLWHCETADPDTLPGLVAALLWRTVTVTFAPLLGGDPVTRTGVVQGATGEEFALAVWRVGTTEVAYGRVIGLWEGGGDADVL